jgi:hypothetical protein
MPAAETVLVSRIKRAIWRARELWAEADYAQRRLLEIQSGQSLLKPEQLPRICTRIVDLEGLYRLEIAEPDYDQLA